MLGLKLAIPNSFLFLFFIILFIYFWLYWAFIAAWAFSSCGEWRLLSSCGAWGSRCCAFSLVAERGL